MPTDELSLAVLDWQKTRSEEQINRLHEDTLGHVRRAAFSIARNYPQLIDILREESASKAYELLSSYQGSSKYTSYLHQAVNNIFCELLRKNKRRDAFMEQAKAESSGVSHAREDEPLRYAELSARVEEALTELHPSARDAWRLYVADLDSPTSIATLAQQLDKTPHSAKCLLFRARIYLRRRLQSYVDAA